MHRLSAQFCFRRVRRRMQMPRVDLPKDTRAESDEEVSHLESFNKLTRTIVEDKSQDEEIHALDKSKNDVRQE